MEQKIYSGKANSLFHLSYRIVIQFHSIQTHKLYLGSQCKYRKLKKTLEYVLDFIKGTKGKELLIQQRHTFQIKLDFLWNATVTLYNEVLIAESHNHVHHEMSCLSRTKVK